MSQVTSVSRTGPTSSSTERLPRPIDDQTFVTVEGGPTTSLDAPRRGWPGAARLGQPL